MRCEKIQELLKSDYLDAEINKAQEEYIREHLKSCPECSKLRQELQQQRLIFRQAKQAQAPQRLWQNIREKIIAEQLKRQKSPAAGFLQSLKRSLWMPPPVFAISGAVAVIVFVTLIAGGIIQKKQSPGREEFIEIAAAYDLNGENDDVLYNFGTNIEEYFL